MREFLPTTALASLLVFFAFTATAQSPYNLNLTDTKDREEINFIGSEQTIHVCGLEIGESYQVWASKAGCHPIVKLVGGAQFNNTIQFVATADCMDFILKKDESSPSCAAGTVWFSIGCNSCAKASNPFNKIQMAGGASPETLIQDVFIGGGCFDVTNVIGIGEPGGRGTFADGGSSILLGDGVALCTGDVGIGNGPNNSNGAGNNIGGPTSDPDLDLLTGGSLNNVQGIEFDFRPTIPNLNFQYVFASEEYCEYVNSGFNDVFGFFISGPGISGGFSNSGQNIAVLPSSGIFVSINNVNHLTNTSFFVPNQDNCGGTTNMNDIQYDGWTQVLVAVANLVPCETYHIRLVIADVGDGIFDSAVFLGGNSFSAGGTATGEGFAASTGSNIVYESCDDGTFVFHRAGNNNSLPLTLTFTIHPSSTATSGVDYVPFPLTITIPPGVDEYVLPVDVITDNIPEGVETIVLTLSNSCSCSSLEIELEIHEPPPLQLALPDVETCAGDPISIEAIPTGGIPGSSYTYLWDNGFTGSTLVAVPNFNTSYSVTVTDECGGSATATSDVQVAQLPTANIVSGGGVLCSSDPNPSVDIVIEFTGTPNWLLEYTINGGPQPPILVTSSPYTLSTNIPGYYQLSNVTSVIGGCVGPATGFANVDLLTITNFVQTTQYTCSEFGTMSVLPSGGMDPFTYTWSNGFPSFQTAIGLTPGNYFVTVTDVNGCSGTAMGTVTTPPQLVSNASGSQVDCSDPNGGTITLSVNGGTSPYFYLWSNGSQDQNPNGLGAGTYTVTVTDLDGCVTTTFATVVANIDVPLAIAQAPDELDCENQVVGLSGQGSSSGPNFSYQWSGPGISGPDDQMNTNAQLEGIYTLIVINNANNCSSSTTVQVTSDYDLPIAVTEGNTLSCNSNFVTINGNGSSVGPNFTYLWSGSGILSPPDSLILVVNEAGTYNLVVTNEDNGCTSSSDAIVINDADAPTAAIQAPAPLTCEIDTIVLNAGNSSTGPFFTYQWLYNNVPIPGATGINTNATSTGNYQIVVTNELNGCTSSFTVPVTSDLATPVVNATANGMITCSNNSVPLNSTVQGSPSGYTFIWTTVNGTFNGPVNGQNANAGTPGTYQVMVTDNDNGCTTTASVQVNQDASIPVVQLTSSGNIDCIETMVQLNGNGSSQSPTITYAWSTVDGNIFSGANTLTPVVDAAGTYTLTLFDSSNNCDNESSVTVTVDNTPPSISMPASPMLDCAVTQATLNTTINNLPTNGVLLYNWSTLDGLISGPSNILNPVAVDPGTYTLLVTNPDNGCTSQASVVVDEDIAPPVATIAAPNELTCTSNTVALNATGTSTGVAFDYNWTTLTGSFATSNTILNPVVDAPGVYILLVTNTLNNCTATQQVTVAENVDLPDALATTPGVLNCNIDELTLSGNGSSLGSEFVYQWSGPGLQANASTLNPLVNEPGVYQLEVTNLLNDCVSTATVTVDEDIAPPTAEAGLGGELSCSVTSMTLDGAGSSTGNNIQYGWTSPNGNISQGENTLNPIINAPGDYFLTVTNLSNGCTSSDIVTIDEDDDLPAVEAQPSPPLTCAVTQLTLSGLGTAIGPEYTYLWSTSNGNIFNGETSLNPVIDAPGIYLLTVTNTLTNCSNIASVTVAAQTASPAVEAGPTDQLTCTETSLSLNGNGSATGTNFAYQWTTVDGNIVNGETSLNPNIDEPGTYILTVINNTTGCTGTDAVTITESLNAPFAVATTPGVLNCTNEQLVLNGNGSSTGSTINYVWSTLDGNIVSGVNTIAPTIDEPGTYTLTVTNTLNGCVQSADVQVGQNITLPTAEAGTADQLTCSTTIISLNGSGSSTGSGITYSWTTNNGNIQSGSTTLNPSVNQTGTYILTVTNTANGCTSTDNVVVTQDSNVPQAAITQPGMLTCLVTDLTLIASASQGANFDYLWTTNNGNILLGETTLSPQINAPGIYVLLVTNTLNGCTKLVQTTVNQDIAEPVADAGSAFVMDCFEELNYLDGSGSTGNSTLSFQWETVDGNLVAGANSAAPSVSEPGTYLLTVTNLANGCTDIDQVEITREGPTSVPVATQPPCHNDKGAIAFTEINGGVPPYLYSIDNGQAFGSQTVYTNLNPGLYQIVVQDANGCEFEEEVLINQPDLFQIEVEPQVTIQLGDSYQINTLVNYPVSEISQVSWFPAIGLSCDDCLDPVASPLNTMNYNVTVVTENGCKDEAPIFLIVKKDGAVFVPNAFSPNGDGTNDVFMIFSDSKSVKNIKAFLVFNRWGETVYQYFNFQPNNPANGWNGLHRNQPMDPAVFTWFAEVEFIDGRIEILKGDVTLLK